MLGLSGRLITGTRPTALRLDARSLFLFECGSGSISWYLQVFDRNGVETFGAQLFLAWGERVVFEKVGDKERY